MGKKMGVLFKNANAHFPINLDPFQKEFGRESGKLLRQFFPEAVAEIKGITDTIGSNNELFTSWMMCMGCCLDIHQGESVEVRGCTAFSFIHENQVYYARNNDLPPFLKKISKSIYYQPANKNRFILNTSSFINGEEGINEHSLVVAMTYVLPKLDEIKPGLNSVFLVRYLLENCKTVQEAVEAVRKLPIASSCNLLLVDQSGSMVVVECNPLKINIRTPEKSEHGEDFIITVNHFSSSSMWGHDASNRNVYFSNDRYQTALNALKMGEFGDSITHARAILKGDFGFMCQYEKALDFETIWSSLFDICNQRIYRAEGNPRTTKLIEDRRLFV
jgi:predicted choloylglycine hydrolase